MNRTTENILTYAPLGIGVHLMIAGHRRIGLAVMAISPITVATQHPRGTKRALKAVPRSLRATGKSVGKSVAQAGKQTSQGLRWLAG